ncbi:hypothetical protein [Rhizorhabdus histidinilytica]|uniref:hypothetical protein n=1 Tax=Rhizorhabdus histidinilytica TaxID=439228 RepID=UPI00321FE369
MLRGLPADTKPSRNEQVQKMLDVLGIQYPGGYYGSRRDLSGVQLADTTVNVFSDMAGGFGHAGIAVGDNPSTGFYPVEPGVGSATGFVPGEIRRDDMSRPHRSYRIPTTPAQEAAIRQSMAEHAADEYNLFLNNCLSCVRARMKDGGVDTVPAFWPNGFIETQRPWIK